MEGVPSQHPACCRWSRLGLGAGMLLAVPGLSVRDLSPSHSCQRREVRLRVPPLGCESPRAMRCPSPSPRSRSKQVGETQHPGAAGG